MGVLTHFREGWVGYARALEIAAFDPPISAQQALKLGWITRIVKDGDTVSEAQGMCREIAARSLHSYGLYKQILTDAFNTSFETQMEHERMGLDLSASHPDGQEEIKAFLEKRRPVFI